MVTRAHRSAARRNASVAAATGVALGVLFLFPASLNHLGAGAGIVAQTADATVGSGSTDSGAVDSSAVDSASVASAAAASTLNGPAVNTRFGPVQVQVQVADGKVVSAQAVDYPQNNGRDRQINAYAVPVLNAEAVDAQGADIDTVSGATYTSVGYKQSLQAALDAAHLA